jgi:chromosome segregation ATPase
VHLEQRLSRLQRTLDEAQREKDTIDPSRLLVKLKQEIATNNYMLNEKLLKDIETQKKSIETVEKIVKMRSVSNADISAAVQKIDQLNQEIMALIEQRDRKDEATEDKLTIYRHQSNNVQRKKANVADELQSTRHSLDHLESVLAAKKREIIEKTGKEDIITSVEVTN